MPRFVFWTVLAGIVAGVAIQIFAAVTRQSDRRLAKLTWLTLGCLLLPFGLIPLTVVIEIRSAGLGLLARHGLRTAPAAQRGAVRAGFRRRFCWPRSAGAR
ncbi:hypothetical protein ABT115_24820 [Streptomyces sp. NPDC001832]|uniref:hypothetical protein n=1 Tax=Streptomyces sp. NPDC001832 TaxID=3154527 RepID=UPI0033248D74